MHGIIAPAGWLFGVYSRGEINKVPFNLNITPINTLENFSDIDFFGELRLELSHGRYGLLLDPTFVKATKLAASNQAVTISTSLLLFDFIGVLNLNDGDAAEFTQNIKIQGLLGGRYFWMRFKVTAPRINSNDTIKWVVPIFGLRVIVPLSPHLIWSIRTDLGGFDIDKVQITWQATTHLSILLPHRLALAIGFRAVGFQYNRERTITRRLPGNFPSKSRSLKLNGIFYGPQIALIWSF